MQTSVVVDDGYGLKMLKSVVVVNCFECDVIGFNSKDVVDSPFLVWILLYYSPSILVSLMFWVWYTYSMKNLTAWIYKSLLSSFLRVCITLTVCPCSFLWTCLYCFYFCWGIIFFWMVLVLQFQWYIFWYLAINSMLCSSLWFWYLYSFSYSSLNLWMVFNRNAFSVLSSAKLIIMVNGITL